MNFKIEIYETPSPYKRQLRKNSLFSAVFFMKFPAANNGVSSISLQISRQVAENALKGIQLT